MSEAAAGIRFADAAAPAGMRLYAIGDVHGRFDLLEAMHAAIAAEIARDRPADHRIIHLGDYVDRGPQSREVIALLHRACITDSQMVVLAGNHEAGLLDFLHIPVRDGLFARFGGVETALSFGVEPDFGSQSGAERTAAALAQAMPTDHVDFLAGLARSVAFGDFFFCHAGIRPGRPLEDQDPADLIWIRDVFLRWPDLHPKVIVHGHTPVRQPEILSNRVNIDTGAFATGTLTAIAVDGRQKRILQVGPEVGVGRGR